MSKLLAVDTVFNAASQMLEWYSTVIVLSLFKIVILCSSRIILALILIFKNNALKCHFSRLLHFALPLPPALYQTILSFSHVVVRYKLKLLFIEFLTCTRH